MTEGNGPDIGPAVGQILARAAQAIAEALPESSPRLEAELLLGQASGLSRTELIAWPERALTPQFQAAFQSLLARRLAGEPIAYIRGRQAFWTLELAVTPDTLIPRPETELLVEIALGFAESDRPRLVADLGTGSGAIAAALASERPAWTLIAVERSAAALAVARANFVRLGLANCLAVQGDWLGALAPARFNLILANPPYVPMGDPHLARGDLRFEPREALTSGPDGLDAIRAIAAQAQRCLVPLGAFAIEHGLDQGPAVAQSLRAAGFSRIQTFRDLAGLERVAMGWA